MNERTKLIFFLFLILGVASCSKSSDSPIETGRIKLTTQWGDRTQGVAIPETYTACIGDKATELKTSSATHSLTAISKGSHDLYVYNAAEKITVSGSVASVETSSGIVASPGWLFSACQSVVVESDKETEVTAVMQQQVRRLDLELTVTKGDIDDVKEIVATLNGVANALDLKSGTYSGTGLKVVPLFTKSGNKLIASVRLIGVTTETQNLTLDVVSVEGSSRQITTDLSSYFSGFSEKKHLPLSLTADISLVSGVGVDYNPTISEWNTQGQLDGDANEQ